MYIIQTNLLWVKIVMVQTCYWPKCHQLDPALVTYNVSDNWLSVILPDASCVLRQAPQSNLI